METNSKHSRRRSVDIDTRNRDRVESNSNPISNLKNVLDFSTSLAVCPGSTNTLSEETSSVSDSFLKLLDLPSNIIASCALPVNAIFDKMERSHSWEFCAFAKRTDSRISSSTDSSLSSLNSYTEFDRILHQLMDPAKDCTENSKSVQPFLTFPTRRKRTLLKRSFSAGECDDEVKIKMIASNHTLLDCEIASGRLDTDIDLSNAEYLEFNGGGESEDSDEEYMLPKRRKIGDASVSTIDAVSSNRKDLNRRWLLNYESKSHVETATEPHDNDTNTLSGQQCRNHSTSTSATVNLCTFQSIRLQRMRSSSVILRHDRPNSMTRVRLIERSYSINVMAPTEEKSFVLACHSSDDESFRPRNWMRASMRLVRPFQLADPPSPVSLPAQGSDSVEIQLPPVFPCDIIERPRSAPTSDRPRQYGRRYSGFVSSSPESPLSNSSSASTLTWENDANGARIATCQRSESTHDQQEVPCGRTTIRASGSAIDSPSSTRPLPTAGTYEMNQESESPLGQWNHGLSSMLACLGCTLGIFNISRFAIFSIHFGANFIFQFLVLTVLIGIPLFTFHISLGQLLGTGVLNMWHISPIFKGIGVALLLSQAFIGVYSIIGVSWMFVYFRDSFISKQDVYRWAEPLELYGEDGVPTLKFNNGSYKIEQTVPDYFGGVVLQRRNVLKQEEDLMNVKFSVAFNLAIVWIIIFLCLSKGLKSYGKVVYIFTILPIFGMTLLCAKLLGFLPGTSKDRSFLPDTDWSEFFLNSKSWIAAFTEVFLTWGVFGASAMQITSHNRQKHFLYRDSALVVIITVSVLLLSAFIAHMCSQLLEYNNFLYLPSSFERSTTYLFLQRRDIPPPHSYTTPIRWMAHSGLILGERTIKPAINICHESGYQPLRLATELVPATFAAIGPKIISPFWSVLFYFVFIMFGLAQQMAIWYAVISSVVSINVKVLKPCWTIITWFTCTAGFMLGLPMTTETGIFVVYFLDFVIGCGWWIMVLYLLQLGAVFIVRGRPYSGETIVTTLFTRSNHFLQNWIAPMFSFNWNVILPVTLLLLSTSVFKNGGYRMLYNWHSPKFYEYWPSWSRKFGCFLQVFPLLTVPLVGIIQSYLYLTDGPLDLFERIQLLYRPAMENSSNLCNQNSSDMEANNRSANNNGANMSANDDPPPKYTPPPSYSTATGARIAKLLRQSFRRSVIRIAHVLGTSDSIPSTSEDHQTSQRQLPPPPDYSTVLVEINQSLCDAIPTVSQSCVMLTDCHHCPDEQSASSTLTAQDVANILRTSLRRNRTLPVHNNLVEQECTSIQCLVESAAPINQDSIIMLDELKTQEQPT